MLTDGHVLDPTMGTHVERTIQRNVYYLEASKAQHILNRAAWASDLLWDYEGNCIKLAHSNSN